MRELNVLVVEDDSVIACLYKHMFKSLNIAIRVVIAGDGTEAIYKVNNQLFNLIFLDINVPKQNGIAVLKDIRSDSINKDTPVIIVSGIGNINVIKELVKEKVSAIIAKPVDWVKFKEVINNILVNHEKS